MGSHMIDSILFSDVFGTEEMREIFDDKAIVANWLEIEVALARAQASLGIIPVWAAEEIEKKAHVKHLDFTEIRKGIKRTGHSLVPTLREFQRHCENGAGEFIHLGATTQDIIDTGFMMAAKKAFEAIYRDIRVVEQNLLNLASQHSGTIMAGRTHGQQALPITAGYKIAIWASEMRRNIERMKEAKERIFVGQLSGAVGTMAGFGEHSFEIHKMVMDSIGLNTPDIAWHASRDRIVELVGIMALVAGTCGKIGNEITALQKSETNEMAEPFAMGMVGSSTMPHKRNPGVSEGMNSLSRIVRANLVLVHDSMIQEHERDGANWKVEWIALPEAMITTGSILAKTCHVTKGLVINAEQMEKNLHLLKGLMLSEAVMLKVGEKLGKQTAHELVYEIAMHTFENEGTFKEYLMQNEQIAGSFTEQDIESVLDPSKYIGMSKVLAEKVVSEISVQRLSD